MISSWLSAWHLRFPNSPKQIGNSLWSALFLTLPWAFRHRIPACKNFGNHPPRLAGLGSFEGWLLGKCSWVLKTKNQSSIYIKLLSIFLLYNLLRWYLRSCWVSDERVGPPWVFQKMETPLFLLIATSQKNRIEDYICVYDWTIIERKAAK